MDFSATPVLGAGSMGAPTTPPPQGLEAGSNISLSDIGRFDHAIYSAAARLDVTAVNPGSPALAALTKPLDQLNEGAEGMQHRVKKLADRGSEMTPADLLNCMVEAQIFTVNCTLMTNVANKASDGVSQLFKQQS
jgi:hypothetical protein